MRISSLFAAALERELGAEGARVGSAGWTMRRLPSLRAALGFAATSGASFVAGACFSIAHEMLATHRLSDKTYDTALAALGLDDLIYAATMVGQFTMTCTTANAFDIDPPADAPIPLIE